MCGIALALGRSLSTTDNQRFDEMANGISPRGESLEFERGSDALLATSRLKIVDRDRAVQPWQASSGHHSLCYNGEVFNHAELRSRLEAEGHPLRSESDTEVVVEAWLAWGEDALLAFRGEFAFGILDHNTGQVFLARDPAGIKPLYFARGEGRLWIASEVKALAHLGLKVEEVPPGHCGVASADSAPDLHPYIDLERLGENEPMIDDIETAAAAVREAITVAVARRVDTDLPVGVILSGGLDSSIVATLISRLHPDCVAFTVGTPGSEDLEYAKRLTADLGMRHVVVELPPRSIGAKKVKEAVRVSESTEYGDAINAVVSMEVFRAVHESGIKVVLTGDGSDELFGGYDMYKSVDDGATRRLFLHKIRQLSRTELQRVDRTSMGQQVEARVPFLDLDLLLLSMRIPVDLKVRDGFEKWIVRHAFAEDLPSYILERHKNPMSHSSGLHERVRLYKPFMSRWYRSFGYDAAGPMRRDFSIELLRAGNDLEAALEAAKTPVDYSASEKLRDLLGALRWNAVNASRPGSSSRAGRN
jgi:asparagine synthase (glutamine-hydrolysing)